MRKLRLDVDDVVVESFSVSEKKDAQGTVHGHTGALGGASCYGTCTDIDDLCTADCTGIGVECYTADGMMHACSAAPCSGPPACTRGTCLSYRPEDC
jgi:hypothetical protein